VESLAVTLPVLYSFRRCPYAMRARLALQASGQTCTLREVLLGQKPEALRDASPKATVPVLVLANGTVLEQSLDIMHWALQSNDPWGWIPASGAAAQHSAQRIADNDGPFKHHLDRYKYPHRFGLVDGLADRAAAAHWLQQWDLLLQRQSCLNGETWGLTDAAIAPFVRQFAHTDMPWFASQPWPALQAWLTAFKNSALFAAAMDKLSPWAPGDAETVFPFRHAGNLQIVTRKLAS
jgi:glutathione S-transferase